MTKKERVIREFSKAMKTANAPYIALRGKFTEKMSQIWQLYIEACQQEINNGRPQRYREDS